MPDMTNVCLCMTALPSPPARGQGEQASLRDIHVNDLPRLELCRPPHTRPIPHPGGASGAVQSAQRFRNRDIGSRRSVAMHRGTFRLTEEPLDEPPHRLRRALDAAGIAHERFWVL